MKYLIILFFAGALGFDVLLPSNPAVIGQEQLTITKEIKETKLPSCITADDLNGSSVNLCAAMCEGAWDPYYNGTNDYGCNSDGASICQSVLIFLGCPACLPPGGG